MVVTYRTCAGASAKRLQEDGGGLAFAAKVATKVPTKVPTKGAMYRG